MTVSPGRRIHHEEALTCCLPGEAHAEVRLPGGAVHRVPLHNSPGLAPEPHVMAGVVEVRISSTGEQPAAAASLLQRVESRQSPEEQQVAAARKAAAHTAVRTMGLRLVDRATGAPLAGVSLSAAAGGRTKTTRTDVRGRAIVEGLGRGPASLRPAGSKAQGSTGQTSPALASLVVRCAHGRTSASRLQVVPTRTRELSNRYALGGYELSMKHSVGAEDAVTVEVKNTDGSPGQARCGGAWSASPARFEVGAKPCESLWPLSAKPTVHTVTGRGADGSSRSVQVEVYPSEKYSGTVKVDPNHDLMQQVSEGLEEALRHLCKALPLDLKPELRGPAGSATLTWGWEEVPDSSEARFVFSGAFGLDPIGEVSLTVEVSLLAVAGMLVAIPPVLTKFLGDHLVDVLLGLKFGVGCRLTGDLELSARPGTRIRHSGSAVVAVTGEVEATLGVKVGSDHVLSLRAEGGGRTGIEGEAEVEAQQDGLYYSPVARTLPLEAFVSVKTRAYIVFVGDCEAELATASWTLVDEWEFYKPGPKKLWPPRDAA